MIVRKGMELTENCKQAQIRGLVILWLLAGPVGATIAIDDGTTHTISSTTTAGDNYDTDYQSTEGGGTLEITGSGLLRFSNQRTISNSFGAGVFQIAGILEQDAPAPSYVYAPVTTSGGAVLRSRQSGLYLMGGGNYAGTPVFDANGGDIWFAGGDHVVGVATLTGSDYLRAYSGTLSLIGGINSPFGAATGGFAVQGGTVVGLLSGLGGGSAGTISVDHAWLGTGLLDTANLRVTGTATVAAGSTLSITNGVIANEGALSQSDFGSIDTDPTDSPAFGVLANKGTWDLLGNADVLNTWGSGQFKNFNTLRQGDPAGHSIIAAAMQNQPGAVIEVVAGSYLRCDHGGTYGAGTEFQADGHLVLGNGTHLVTSANLTGSGFLDVAGLDGSVGLIGSVGPETGPASGGFAVSGGTVNGLGGLLGGQAGTCTISAERGRLGWGTLNAANLRFTGSAEKVASSLFGIVDGTLTNEGTMTQHTGGHFELDPDDTTQSHGTIVNLGSWNLEGTGSIQNSHGEGVFENHGILRQASPTGFSLIYAKVSNQEYAIIQADAGSKLVLNGGGSYQTGTEFHADGHLVLGNGTHVVTSANLTGSGFLDVAGL
ncbi:MAG: hypothetical protein ABI600_15170, partial [Luteolibacter sp.]